MYVDLYHCFTVSSTYYVSPIFGQYPSEIRIYKLHSDIDLNELKSPYRFQSVSSWNLHWDEATRCCFFSMGIVTGCWRKDGHDLLLTSHCTKHVTRLPALRHDYYNRSSAISIVERVHCQQGNARKVSDTISSICLHEYSQWQCHRDSTDSFVVSINGLIVAKYIRTWKDFLIHWDWCENDVSMCDFRREIGGKGVLQNKWNML